MYYKPPEILLYMKTYSISVDIWSLGCILAELFFKEPIFKGISETDQMMAIFKVLGSPHMQTWPSLKHTDQKIKHILDLFPKFVPKGFGFLKNKHTGFDECALDLISKMLVLNPVERLTARQILSHPWFNDVREC